MALIICSECGKEYSNNAPRCPNCANPTPHVTLRLNSNLTPDSKQDQDTTTTKAQKIKEEKKNRGNCVSYIIALIIIFIIFRACSGSGSDDDKKDNKEAASTATKDEVIENDDTKETAVPDKANDEEHIEETPAEKEEEEVAEVVEDSSTDENMLEEAENEKQAKEKAKAERKARKKAEKAALVENSLETFNAGGYYFITYNDLDTYYNNLIGQNIYIVANIDDFSDNEVQFNLDEGYVYTGFYTDTDYSKYFKKGDRVAILGTVEEKTDALLLKLKKIQNSQIFAYGKNAEQYQRDTTDEALAPFLTVTAAVADDNEVGEGEYKALCEYYDYNDIMRNPDNYNGRYTVVTGTVDQVVEGLFGMFSIYINDGNGNKWGCTYRYETGEPRLLEGDYVTVYGKCKGTTTATTILGGQVTLPEVSLKYIR